MFPPESRTALSLKNIKVNTVMNIAVLLLQFFTRKIFIDKLGAEVIGLNSTAYNMLEFLNFAELGIVSGVRFMLYKPYHDQDRDKINEIVTLQGYIYRRISLLIIGLAAALMCLFPLIFSKMTLPLWYAYASFSVLLYYYLIGNFVNYRQVMFHVSQHAYRLNCYMLSVGIAKNCFQIATIYYFPYPYLWWLTSEILFTTLSAIIVSRLTRRHYPFLRKSELPFSELLRRHSILVVKVRQLFFHRIGAIVLTKTTPVIIYAFISLTEVALYGNYKMLVKGVEVLSSITFGSIASGIGNLVAEDDRGKSIRVFHEIFSVRILMTAVFAFGIMELASPLVSLWLGKDYVMPQLTIGLIVMSLALSMLRMPFDMYIQASGMFQDVWAPVTETVINLGCAIAGGFLFGLNGILGGSIVGSTLIVLLWKPYFLCRKGFQTNCNGVAMQFLRLCVVSSVCVLAVRLLLRFVSIDPYSGWTPLFIYGSLACGSFATLLLLLSFLTDKPLRQFLRRFTPI